MVYCTHAYGECRYTRRLLIYEYGWWKVCKVCGVWTKCR